MRIPATESLAAASRCLVNTGGFTLIGPLAVIASIAILMAMFLPALGKSKTRAQGIKCINKGATPRNRGIEQLAQRSASSETGTDPRDR